MSNIDDDIETGEMEYLGSPEKEKQEDQKMTDCSIEAYIGKYILVSTSDDDLFFGKLLHYERKEDHLVLEQSQLCVYWDEATVGFNNLAVNGPNEMCKITKAAKRQHLMGISYVTLVTDAAIENWKKYL